MASDYVETTRSRLLDDQQFVRGYVTRAVATLVTDTGIPAVGDALDGGDGDTVTVPVCTSVNVMPGFEEGRVLIIARWTNLKLYASA